MALFLRPRRWLPWRWLLVAVAMIVTCALGFTGFAEHFHQCGEHKTIADILYLTLQLFTMNSGTVDGPMPGTLDLARFLGPLVAAYTVVNAAVGLFSTQLHRIWIWLVGRHAVVCGLGRKGVRLAEQLRAAGRQVIVIEPDEQNPHLAQCKELGCLIVHGRANDPWNLRRAYVRRARLLVAMAGDDGVNIETAVRAHELVAKRRGRPLRCIAHVSDPNLQNVFRRHHVFTADDDPFELELFNTYEMAARVMLRQAGALDVLQQGPHPVAGAKGEGAGPHPSGEGEVLTRRVIIVGLGQLGEALLVRLLKDWLIEPPAGSSLSVTVIDVAADERRRHFAQRFPRLAAQSNVEFLPLDIHDSQLAAAGCFTNPPGNRAASCSSPQAVFICLDNDSQALYAALMFRGLVAAGTPIIVRMSEESGLATVLGITAASDGVLPHVTAVGLLDTACSLELVQGGTREILAQAIHQGYVMDQLAAGGSPLVNPALAPWHRLPDDLKQSNREQADHIRNKLRLIGCELAAQPGNPVELFQFTDDEVERLAQIEHDRWTAERRAAGWKYGPAKEIDRKISPHLVAWRQLAEDARQYNRDAVRRIPKVLAKADFAIRRVERADVVAMEHSSSATVTPRRRGAPRAA